MLWKIRHAGDDLRPGGERGRHHQRRRHPRDRQGLGDVTKKDINTVLPFGNTLAVVYVTGAELLEALEASTYCTPESIGGFPQAAGLTFTVATYEKYDANHESLSQVHLLRPEEHPARDH